MKTLIATSVMTALLISGVAVMAQDQKEDYLGLPGDNLNLFAVMKLFQESKTLEEFERNLNDENSRINNLDLNGDNLIDYISVFDNVNGNVHNIVLQVAIDKKERQDVAVFTVERDNNGNVLLQLTGDEELYGQNYIIEPNYDETLADETPNPGYAGNAASVNGRQVNVVRTTVVEVAAWPLVTYIYTPGYVVWRSSWYWGYYPSYWRPWRPYYWHYYYGYHYHWYDHYYAHYRPWHRHRHNYWHDYYYRPHRMHSTTVNIYVKNGNYKTTYSRPDERVKGEALYTSTHRDSPTRRTESTRVADGNRRTTTTEATRKSTGGTAAASNRRSESSVSTRASGNNRSSGEARSSESRSQVKSAPATRQSGRTSEARTSGSKSGEAAARNAAPVKRESATRSSAPERRETVSRTSSPERSKSEARSSAPQRREATPRASSSVKRESKSAAAKSGSSSKSRESSSKSDGKSDSRRR